MTEKRVIRILYHRVGGQRDESEGMTFVLPEEQESFDRKMKRVLSDFNVKKRKWYMVIEAFLDTITPNYTTKVLASAAHEEIPPLELNKIAKDKPAPKSGLEFLDEPDLFAPIEDEA